MQRIKPPMSKILFKKYITIYERQRKEGYTGESAHFKTLFNLQEVVINYMVLYPKEINVIASAFENIKSDPSIKEKAQIYFDLGHCDDKIKAKYMPLVLG